MLVNHNQFRHFRAHGLALLLGACGLGVLASPARGGGGVKSPELFSHTNQDEFHHPIDPIDTGHLIPGGPTPEPRWLDIIPSTSSLDLSDGSEPHGLNGLDSPNAGGFDFDATSGLGAGSVPGGELAFAGAAAPASSVRSFLSPDLTLPDLDLARPASNVVTGGGLTSPIPAPGVLVILALGCGLGGRRRRRS